MLPSGRKFKPRKAWFSGNRQSCRNLGFPDFIGYFIKFSIRSGSVFYPRNLACSDPARVYDQETLLLVFGLLVYRLRRPLCTRVQEILSLCVVVIKEVCQGPMGQGGLHFRLAAIQGLPLSLCVSNLYPPKFSPKSQFI
nr:uncharacterized protein LOC108169416 isoform X1 [Malus domestica]